MEGGKTVRSKSTSQETKSSAIMLGLLHSGFIILPVYFPEFYYNLLTYNIVVSYFGVEALEMKSSGSSFLPSFSSNFEYCSNASAWSFL
jgi:hypothetical protein